KANVIADALSRKEMDKPLCVRALMMTVHNDLPKHIREAQEEAIKGQNVNAKNLGRLIKQIFKFRLMKHVVLGIVFGCRDSED
nr:putative reverse transcriptase domain-containing protein [Tanacetum cinerariifolium]